MKIKIPHQLLALVVCWGLLCSVSAALTVNFNGTLVVTPPECTVNGAATTDVLFGDVHETLIDNSNYKRTKIEYPLNCTYYTDVAESHHDKWSECVGHKSNEFRACHLPR